MYKLPLLPYPNQTFSFTMPVNSQNERFIGELHYNAQGKYWNFSLFYASGKTPIIVNLPLLASMYKFSNLFCQLDYLRIGSLYIGMKNETPNSAPDDTDLGTNYIVVWGDNEYVGDTPDSE